MHRLDGISIYQNNAGQGAQTSSMEGMASDSTTQADAVHKNVVARAAAVKQELIQLVRGTVFEGVVTAVKGDTVLLSMNNGQSLQARLENGVNVQLGEPVLFEVKANQDGQIVLKQVPVMSEYNPTLQKALQAAGLNMTERNLDMVNTMMQKQMPIDKGNLNAMARLMQQYPKASAETLVEMKKLGFPINETAILQFDSYKAGEHSLAGRFTEMMEQIPELFQEAEGAGGMAELQGKILDILQPDTTSDATMAGTETTAGSGNTANAAATVGSGNTANAAATAGSGNTANAAASVGELLNQQQTENLQQQLSKIPGMERDSQLFSEGKLNTTLTAGELLHAIQENVEQAVKEQTAVQEQWSKAADKVLKELFGGREYKSLLKQVMEEQWLLKPEQAEKKENIEQLYQRINRQMESLEQLLTSTGKESQAVGKNVSQVQGNLEMMNQINQLYNYVQIPLKLHNQQAHSDLYVYTNKKRLLDKEGELSALLHLELDNLGTTDVQIKMLGSNVTTNFYLSDDVSFRLIEQHIDDLQENLEKKGYNCSIHLENREKKVDFVEDFLEHEAPIGKLQRYSFDVRT